MVRTSARQQTLKRLDELTTTALKNALTLQALGLSTARVDALTSIAKLKSITKYVTSTRHLQRGKYRTRREKKFELCLRTDHDDFLVDREFKFHFRVSRPCFWELAEHIKDHTVFKRKDSRGRHPKPAAHQLLVLLKYFGSEGNSGSSNNLSTFFGIGTGSVDDYKKHALIALLTLEDRTYFWPTAEERKATSARIKDQWLFPNCVGLIDGTLLPLFQRPPLHGENCRSRKKFYAIVMLVVCDDLGRILYYHIGWPGGVHDNRAWRNSKLCKRPGRHFSRKEYLLGDSAFTPGMTMVPPFKCNAGQFIDSNQSAFNTHLAKPRVKSEHCIGTLKGRLPFLRNIRMKLGNKIHMDRIVDNVRAAMILHNFLIAAPVDADWTEEETIDDLEPETSNVSNEADYTRRNELMYYFSELEDTTIN